jgi:hypothetical protein
MTIEFGPQKQRRWLDRIFKVWLWLGIVGTILVVGFGLR